jgi:hypothetical protein
MQYGLIEFDKKVHYIVFIFLFFKTVNVLVISNGYVFCEKKKEATYT